MLADYVNAIDERGYTLLPAALGQPQTSSLLQAIEASLESVQDEAVALRNRAGVYGARNLLDLCAAAINGWQTPGLRALLQTVLGTNYGLVRGLFFDKPPERSWSLPWHQDLTIAVQEHRFPSQVFSKPTIKAGVPHVEASEEILRTMLTLRIHLDPVSDENGPLQVLPGTHRRIQSQPSASSSPIRIYAQAGDVLAMRPLLYHASGASLPETQQHRRILHLEFAASRALPEGYQWHRFLTADDA